MFLLLFCCKLEPWEIITKTIITHPFHYSARFSTHLSSAVGDSHEIDLSGKCRSS